MDERMVELRCPAELALKLGALNPRDLEQHRQFRASGHYMLVRDPVTLLPMFWEIIRAGDVTRE